MTSKVRIPPSAWKALRPLAAEASRLGLALYVVGGAVRDWLKGLEADDLDLASEGDPSPIAGLCARLEGARAQAFDQFGTSMIRGRRFRFDFARTRREVYERPAALPRVSPASIREDLFRRDFTINAAALRLSPSGAGELIDPCGGLRDLRARLLRVLHPASFRDDPTRVFRAARYLCRLRLRPAPGTLAMARAALREGHAALLSRHRLAQELLRVLEEREPSRPLRLLRRWGYLQLLHPRLGLPRAWAKTPEERLGLLALSLGEEGSAFLRSLPLERGLSSQILEALRLAGARASPRATPFPLAARLLSLAFPRLPRQATCPLMIGGRDIEALGIPPGKDYRRILESAARAQWEGRFGSRPRALAWLRAQLASPVGKG